MIRLAAALTAFICVAGPAHAINLRADMGGCKGAPEPNAYTIQHRDFFTGYAAQSVGVTNYHGNASKQPAAGLYTHTPSSGVAGVDCPVGPDLSSLPAGQTALVPVTQATAANWGTHCSLNKTTWNVGCGGEQEAGITINGVDFSAGANAVGLTGATLYIANVTGPCVIKNSVVRWGPAATTWSGKGGWMVYFSGCSSVTILNSVIDGVGDAWALHNNGGAQSLMMLSSNSGASLTIQKSAFLRCPARCFQWGARVGANSPSANVTGNYFEGFGYCPQTLGCYHGEWFFINPPMIAGNPVGNDIISEVIDSNTFLEPANADGPNTAQFVPRISNPPCATAIPNGCKVRNFSFTNNVLVEHRIAKQDRHEQRDVGNDLCLWRRDLVRQLCRSDRVGSLRPQRHNRLWRSSRRLHPRQPRRKRQHQHA